jgi:hypothetical protein
MMILFTVYKDDGVLWYSNNETDNRNITEILLKSGVKLSYDPDHDVSFPHLFGIK